MCPVTSRQVFIVGSPLEPILNVTLDDDDDCQKFLLPPFYVANNIHKDQNFFCQICTNNRKKLHDFPSHLWHICKVCNSFFYMVENCATFQNPKGPGKKKKKPCSNISHMFLLFAKVLHSNIIILIIKLKIGNFFICENQPI